MLSRKYHFVVIFPSLRWRWTPRSEGVPDHWHGVPQWPESMLHYNQKWPGCTSPWHFLDICWHFWTHVNGKNEKLIKTRQEYWYPNVNMQHHLPALAQDCWTDDMALFTSRLDNCVVKNLLHAAEARNEDLIYGNIDFFVQRDGPDILLACALVIMLLKLKPCSHMNVIEIMSETLIWLNSLLLANVMTHSFLLDV